MGLSGRLHWPFALLGGLMPFFSFAFRNALGIFRAFTLFKSFSGKKTNQTSKVQDSSIKTDYLEMTLDHSSGELNGKILKGVYIGCNISDLNYDSLVEMLDICREDEESISLLRAYIERAFPDQNPTEKHAENLDTIDELQALNILGLDSNPSKEDIIKAHRRLIQKMHPDRGGTTYLAARINEAKTLLLGRKK